MDAVVVNTVVVDKGSVDSDRNVVELTAAVNAVVVDAVKVDAETFDLDNSWSCSN